MFDNFNNDDVHCFHNIRRWPYLLKEPTIKNEQQGEKSFVGACSKYCATNIVLHRCKDCQTLVASSGEHLNMRAKQQSGAGSPDFLWPICEGHISGRRVEPRWAQYQPHTECFVKQICVSRISAKKSGVRSLYCHLSPPPPWAGHWSDDGPAPWRLHALTSSHCHWG